MQRVKGFNSQLSAQRFLELQQKKNQPLFFDQVLTAEDIRSFKSQYYMAGIERFKSQASSNRMSQGILSKSNKRKTVITENTEKSRNDRMAVTDGSLAMNPVQRSQEFNINENSQDRQNTQSQFLNSM